MRKSLGVGGVFLLVNVMIVGCGGAQNQSETVPLLNGETTVEASEELISFPSEGLDLRGYLTLPQRVVSSPVPAVILVAGSGPSSADGAVPGQLNMTFGFRIPVYKELAIGLRELGVAVLRYDKRSCGPFNDCADNDYPLPSSDLVIDAFGQDVLAAVQALKARPEIDPKRIWVLGHSQGGTIIPWVMDQDPDIAGGVFVAAPFSPIDDLLLGQVDQTRDVLTTMGVAEGQVETMVADFDQVAKGVADLRSKEATMNLLMGASEVFWSSWLQWSDQVPALTTKLEKPMLFLGGEYDWNVPPSELEAWRDHFKDSDGPTRKFVSLPCLTHALNCVSESDFTKIRPEHMSKRISSDLIGEIGAFVKRN